MSHVSPARRRADRVAALELPPGMVARAIEVIQRPDVQARIALCVAAALVMWVITFVIPPPLPFRLGFTPTRAIVAAVEFSREDPVATAEERIRAQQDIRVVYTNDPQPLIELRHKLKDRVFQLLKAESYEAVDHDIWREFQPPLAREVPRPEAMEPPDKANSDAWLQFRLALASDQQLVKFDEALTRALAPFRDNGILARLQHEAREGRVTELSVHFAGQPDRPKRVDLSDVHLPDVQARLEASLEAAFTPNVPERDLRQEFVERISAWLKPQLPNTLSKNVALTEQVRREAKEAVQPVVVRYRVGQELVPGGRPLTEADLNLLRMEYNQLRLNRPWGEWLLQSLADLGMFVALYVLCGTFIYHREPQVLTNFRRFALLLGLIVLAVACSRLAAMQEWRAEMIPVLLFGMIVTLVWRSEMALLLTASLSLVVTMTLSQSLGEFVLLFASASAAVLMMGPIRSRTRLLYVGMWAGAVAALTTLGIGTLLGQPLFIRSGPPEEAMYGLAVEAAWAGFWALLAGLIMTGLLPFVERLFDVQTEMRLLELGDIAHPLLQELVRRAPGTYNHSINVASIAEAAAEAIGGNGLLVRVGAYFHDIGKMFKPSYFIENQGIGASRHDSLQPQMSALVIIAHVKDGADLGRQHNLPQVIIDFIEQHHGTTLVEFFYQEARRDAEADPDAGDVDESVFRYPGPKPQSKEAAVMMLADAVEGACRTLVDPTPSRIESLVKAICMKRLMDGQFEECDLTLEEIHDIETSLVKSLTAVYHGRVKYPDQATAER